MNCIPSCVLTWGKSCGPSASPLPPSRSPSSSSRVSRLRAQRGQLSSSKRRGLGTTPANWNSSRRRPAGHEPVQKVKNCRGECCAAVFWGVSRAARMVRNKLQTNSLKRWQLDAKGGLKTSQDTLSRFFPANRKFDLILITFHI